jgi:LPXTG-motif cell wall-anchored protein
MKKIKESRTYINIKYLPKYEKFFAKDIGDIPATVIKTGPGMNLYIFIGITVLLIAMLIFLITKKNKK